MPNFRDPPAKVKKAETSESLKEDALGYHSRWQIGRKASIDESRKAGRALAKLRVMFADAWYDWLDKHMPGVSYRTVAYHLQNYHRREEVAAALLAPIDDSPEFLAEEIAVAEPVIKDQSCPASATGLADAGQSLSQITAPIVPVVLIVPPAPETVLPDPQPAEKPETPKEAPGEGKGEREKAKASKRTTAPTEPPPPLPEGVLGTVATWAEESGMSPEQWARKVLLPNLKEKR